METEQITSFLGWLALWNFVFLGVCAVLVIPFKGVFSRLHGWLFDVEPQVVRGWYFGFLAIWEVMIIAFMLLPYLVLRMM